MVTQRKKLDPRLQKKDTNVSQYMSLVKRGECKCFVSFLVS